MSLSKDMTELGIPRTTLNLLRNDLIKFKCGPLVYRTIIHWGFPLPIGKKIKDNIKDLEIEEKIKDKHKTDIKKWMKRNESKINKDSFSDFDITALHDFLPILCYDKIAQTGCKEYEKQTKDPSSVESLLKEIKAFRNDVSHEYDVAADDSHIDKTKEKMRECIKAAGKLYSKDQTEIDEKVTVLDDEFDKVLLDTTHFYENRVKYIAKFIENEVPANLLERYSPHFSVPLPGSWSKKNTSDIFQCSNLSVTTDNKKGKTKANKNIFPCTEIYNNNQNNFVVINGGPGSGKTTLMRNMCQDILQTSVHGSTPRYDKIEQFKIPIYLECRFEQQTNIAKFLRECLKDFLSPEDDILEAFKLVKCLVFLIDGYDEINNNCRQLVDSIIIFCRDYNVSCIVSSRVDAGNNFINELQDMNLNCTTMYIEPICEMSDKVNFLRSYGKKMDNSIDTLKLVNSFENLTEAAIEVFSAPILLALFISLFVHDPDSVSQLKNEQSAYEAVRTNFLREMVRKLRNASYPKGTAEEVAYLLSKFCLTLFNARKYFLDGKDYSNMVSECKKIKRMPDNVDIPSLLSCILTPEHSFKFPLKKSYHFMHSTIQESFAAKYLSKNIKELRDDKNSQSQSEDRQLSKLFQVLGLDGSHWNIQWDMGRYGNIIKLLMLEILANGELSQYSNTFKILIKKCYKPVYRSPEYHLNLILSSGSNADIISIVSDCMIDWGRYDLQYYRHIKPMIEVAQSLKTGVVINLYSTELTNNQQIIKLLTVLGEDSEIMLSLHHSHDNYQPLDGEFYMQLKNSKCKLTKFEACIASGEHLSILTGVYRGDQLDISTPSVTDISFAALEEYKGVILSVAVKYTDDCPTTGSNPVRDKTYLTIEHIPANGKENLYNIIKYICPKSKKFSSIYLNYCHLTDTDAHEMLKQLHREKIITDSQRTDVSERRVNEDKSRTLQLYLVSEKSEIIPLMTLETN